MAIINTSIQNIKEIFKENWIDEIIWFCLSLVILLLAFSFGALFERNRVSSSGVLSIEAHSEVAELWKQHQEQSRVSAKYFGSRGGKTAYTFDCSVGNRVAEKNRVFFSSLNEVQELGYQLSSRC